jgi:DNA-binding MarR family transcriptional regulator
MSDAVRGVARLGRLVERIVNDHQLSLSQYRILDRLVDGAAGGRSLAEWLAVKPPSITALVDGLVRRGLVERGDDVADRRLVNHSLTDEGRTIHSVVSAAIAARLFEVLGDDPDGDSLIESLVQWSATFDRLAQAKKGAAPSGQGS